MLLESPPDGMLTGPTFRGDPLRVIQSRLEYSSGLFGDASVGKANDQFIIDVEASRVQVCRSNVYRLINNEEFSVQNLGLVFVNLDSVPEQAQVQALRGEPRYGNIRFARQQQLHPSATAHHVDQLVPQLPARQEVRYHNLNGVRPT